MENVASEEISYLRITQELDVIENVIKTKLNESTGLLKLVDELRENSKLLDIELNFSEEARVVLAKEAKNKIQNLKEKVNGISKNVAALLKVQFQIIEDNYNYFVSMTEHISHPPKELPKEIQNQIIEVDKTINIINISQPSPYFVGREQPLEEIKKKFSKNEESLKIQCIVGLGGIGKTQVALQYAKQNKENYSSNIRWINAENENTLKSSFKELAFALKLVIHGTIEDIVRAIYRKLSCLKKVLLIFDNAENMNTLVKYLPSSNDPDIAVSIFHILITSRNQYWEEIVPIHLDVKDKYMQKDAISYVIDVMERFHNKVKMAEAQKLANELGFLALAIAQAVAYIIENKVSISNYLKAYSENYRVVLSNSTIINDHYEHNVLTTWILSCKKVKKESKNAIKILKISAYLNSDDIPIFLFDDFFKNEQSASAIDRLIKLLTRYSLISVDTDERCFNIHRLLQKVILLENLSKPSFNLYKSKNKDIKKKQKMAKKVS